MTPASSVKTQVFSVREVVMTITCFFCIFQLKSFRVGIFLQTTNICTHINFTSIASDFAEFFRAKVFQ